MQKHIGKFYLSDDNEFILTKYEKVHALLKDSYWASLRDADTMRLAMENSLNYALFETASGCLAGYARVITDFATMYYLCDVFISGDFRARGLGKAMLEHIIFADQRLSGLSGTLKTRDAQGLYKKYGFEESPVSCMFRSQP